MNKKQKALIINIISLVIVLLLLNFDSLFIKDYTGLIVFRATYITIFTVLFVMSVINSKNTGYIPGLFDPIIKRYNEFPRNYQIFIGFSIAIGLLMFFALAIIILIYVY